MRTGALQLLGLVALIGTTLVAGGVALMLRRGRVTSTRR
jgi:hypothetical protein